MRIFRTWDDVTEEVEIQWCNEAYNDGYLAFTNNSRYPKYLPHSGMIYENWLNGWAAAKADYSSKDKSI